MKEIHFSFSGCHPQRDMDTTENPTNRHSA
eukprot:COSAG06_NODE_4622_length_4092_cov_2.411971_8_plen_29_part_01